MRAFQIESELRRIGQDSPEFHDKVLYYLQEQPIKEVLPALISLGLSEDRICKYTEEVCQLLKARISQPNTDL
jgi:hypothetical protein